MIWIGGFGWGPGLAGLIITIVMFAHVFLLHPSWAARGLLAPKLTRPLCRGEVHA